MSDERSDRIAPVEPTAAADAPAGAGAAGLPRGGWAVLAVAVVLIAALAFAVGRFTTFGGPAGPNAADIGFARDMQEHHAQAVEIAMIEHAATTNDDLRFTSYDIATGQSAQNGEMYGWLVEWGVPPYGSEPLMAWMDGSPGHRHDLGESPSDEELRAEMGMATDAQLAELRASAGTRDGDCLFVSLMTEHHRGALDMTAAILDLGSDERVHRVAGAMSETQSREIEALETIGSRLGCD